MKNQSIVQFGSPQVAQMKHESWLGIVGRSNTAAGLAVQDDLGWRKQEGRDEDDVH